MTNNCTLWPNNTERCSVIAACQQAFGSLSFVGCLFIIFVIVILRSYKLFVQKLILSYAVTELFKSTVYIIADGALTNKPFCQTQAFIMEFFDWASILWMLVITINCLVIVLNKSLERFFIWLHVFVWLLATLVAVIPFINDAYGPAGIWCWIKREKKGMRFGIFYAPVFFLVAVMIIIYAFVTWKIFKKSKPSYGGSTSITTHQFQKWRKELYPLLAYPIIFVLLFTPTFVYRVEDAVHEDNPPKYVLTVLSSIFVPAIGFVNAISYIVFQSAVKELSWLRIKRRIKVIFSSQIDHKIHEDYPVIDEPTSESEVPKSPTSTFEMQVTSSKINTTYGTES